MTDALKLKIKVVPGASKSGVSGWLGEMLKVRVAAPPEKGKANTAVLKLLAKELQLPESALSIAAGGTSQLKVIEIQGVTMAQVLRVFPADR